MAVRQAKHLYLDSDVLTRLEALARRKGGRRAGFSVSAEANRLIRRALEVEEADVQDARVAPLIQEILDTRLTSLHRHLASMLAKAGADAATCMLICTRLLSGDTVAPEDLEEVYTDIRQMAVEHFKKREHGLPGVRDPLAIGER